MAERFNWYINRAIRELGRSRNGSADRRRQRQPGLERLEYRCLLSTIVDFRTPTTDALPYATVEGADGEIWFTEAGVGKIGVINPATDAISEYPLPSGVASSALYGITSGSDGNIWFTDGGNNAVGTINVTTHAITEFTVPTANSLPFGVTSGPDGNIWFTEQQTGAIGFINPMTHAFSAPFTITPSGSLPTGITVGPDGDLWFTEEGINAIASINPETGHITQYPITSGITQPFDITVGSDGNLWFTGLNYSGVGKFDPATGVFTAFPISTPNSSGVEITSGPDGDLYFAELDVNKIGVINPTTGVISDYESPTANSQPYGVTAGPDGTVWFTEASSTSSGIGVITLSTQLAVTPPATVTAGVPFGVTVSVEYATGVVLQTVDTGQATIELGNDPGGDPLSGTMTASFHDGVATFSGLTLDHAANGYTVSATSNGMGTATSGSFSVVAAAGTQLLITTEPQGVVTAGQAFGLTAEVEDRFGNLATGYDGTVGQSWRPIRAEAHWAARPASL